MGKRKHKPKEQKASDDRQRGTPELTLLKEEEGGDELSTKHSDKTKEASDNQKTTVVSRFVKWMGREKYFTDWVVAIFTVVLAMVGVLQFVILSNQLTDSRKEQRPWIRVWTDDAAVKASPNGVVAKAHLLNSGKTPAKSVYAEFFVERVQNGAEPLFKEIRSTRLSTGSLFPNLPP